MLVVEEAFFARQSITNEDVSKTSRRQNRRRRRRRRRRWWWSLLVKIEGEEEEAVFLVNQGRGGGGGAPLLPPLPSSKLPTLAQFLPPPPDPRMPPICICLPLTPSSYSFVPAPVFSNCLLVSFKLPTSTTNRSTERVSAPGQRRISRTVTSCFLDVEYFTTRKSDFVSSLGALV